ncbi:hypothetical protein NDU88_004243 [Pleurodeles waltl]|uniref:Protein phosphatase 1 regulatory subunit 37 n=1 Tax=Pleurodeles waltl TaxID=8319 RepID=A0AAV7MSX4_PLEWA|nr:hypothetical protein NDU88_004243 [Pleurodeles waltl]
MECMHATLQIQDNTCGISQDMVFQSEDEVFELCPPHQGDDADHSVSPGPGEPPLNQSSDASFSFVLSTDKSGMSSSGSDPGGTATGSQEPGQNQSHEANVLHGSSSTSASNVDTETTDDILDTNISEGGSLGSDTSSADGAVDSSAQVSTPDTPPAVSESVVDACDTNNSLDLSLGATAAESSLPDLQANGKEIPGQGSAHFSQATEDENGKNKHGPKRVTFPSDDDIVSGAVEPKDPWRHAQNVTVDEIIGAYKQACQKLNCKQIPKLIKQLQEFQDLTRRIDCLDLKGEKLDYKACEALEEIFKRVQFKILDLEQTNLDEDGASALFDMIEYYESATHLNISFNKHIGTRGWQAAAHMMRKTNCLQYLDARNTPLLDHSAPFVARALRISSSLTVLHLENASLSGRPLMLLGTALKMNMNLRELYLADNKLNGLQDSAQLGNLLKFNCYIQILDLRNNHILDGGLAYICEGLKEQRKGLITLVLWNNQLTHSGMTYLGMTLPHTQSLETLNLGHNPIGNEGVRNLKTGLIGNRTVLRLGLASTKLTCEGAVAVAEFIAESPRLLRLDLRENEIKTGGMMALSLALKVNHSLLRLDLDREPKKESVKSFIDTQKALLAEIQNGCKRNFILAKEKEENEHKMQLSTSMPEITVTEPAAEEVIVEDSNEISVTESTEQAEEVVEVLVSDHEDIVNTVIDEVKGTGEAADWESDSDTEDEEEATVKVTDQNVGTVKTVVHPLGSTSVGNDTCSTCETYNPPSSQYESNSDHEGKSEGARTRSPERVDSESNERRISVSSPGRGHKIFVVTRVESPPEKSTEKTHGLTETSDAHTNLSGHTHCLPQLLPPKTLALDAQPNGSIFSPRPVSNPDGTRMPSTDQGLDTVQIYSTHCESPVSDAPLPNGLKAAFVHGLPDVSSNCDMKLGSCTVDHELNCSKNEKELEELLRDASQDAGQETL